jgi:hypothetical protein
MGKLRDKRRIRCLLVRILLLWLHTPMVTSYSHRHTGRNSSSAAFDGKCHRRSTRYVQVYQRRADKRATSENKNQSGASPAWRLALDSRFSCFRLACWEVMRLGTTDPPGLACLHACHAQAVIDKRDGLRSNMLRSRRTGYRQARRPLSILEAFEAPTNFH